MTLGSTKTRKKSFEMNVSRFIMSLVVFLIADLVYKDLSLLWP